MTVSYIALGSNLDHPLKHVRQGFEDLAELPDSELIAKSRLYQTKALTLDDKPQPDYINAVAKIKTQLQPLELLAQLKMIEAQHGRVPTQQRWTARTLDLDILLYGDLTMKTEKLTLPHPQMHERNFVLIPLAEVKPDVQLPH